MKIYIEVEGKYILLDNESKYTNHEDDSNEIEVLDEALNKLDILKERIQRERQKRGGYLVKKLGVYPTLNKNN